MRSGVLLVDLQQQSSMTTASQSLVIPSITRSPMLMDTSPVAVSNKIRAIQARKTRLILQPTDADIADIRPLNFHYGKTSGGRNSQSNLSVFTAEKLFDRSKDTRLDRLPSRQPARPSFLSSTSANQQSLLWPNYQSSTTGQKQLQTQSNSTTVTPPAFSSTKNKSTGGQMPSIRQSYNRRPFAERQNSLALIDSQAKTKPTPRQQVNDDEKHFLADEEDEEEQNLPMDEEFERYFEQAIVKCADWLMKYVFNPKNNVIDC